MTLAADQTVLDRIRAEYLEMPGMRLKVEQLQRLVGVERSMCEGVLASLVGAKFLYWVRRASPLDQPSFRARPPRPIRPQSALLKQRFQNRWRCEYTIAMTRMTTMMRN
jgi:hypothetical protein